MAYTELNNVTSLGQLFSYPTSVFNSFYNIVLLGLFLIVTSSTYFSQRRLTGEGDLLASLSVASWLVLIVASIMSLIEGMLPSSTLIIVIGVTILTTILLLLSRK